MSDGYIVAIELLALCSIIIGLVVYSCKQSDKKWNKRKKEDEDWEAAELAKPKYYITFVTIDNVEKRTNNCLPYQFAAGSTWNYHKTSKQSAQAYLEQSYERGYFLDNSRVSYPVCNIKFATISVEKEKNDGQSN